MVHFAAKIAKKCENLILEVWVQPRFPLAIFMFENPRNGRFRSVSDQEKKRNLFFCLTAAKSSMEVDAGKTIVSIIIATAHTTLMLVTLADESHDVKIVMNPSNKEQGIQIIGRSTVMPNHNVTMGSLLHNIV